MKKIMKTLLSALSLFLLSAPAVFASTDAHTAHDAVSAALPIWSIIPFAGMLLSIAVIPLVKPEWWEHNMLKVALAWSAVFIIPFGRRLRSGGGSGTDSSNRCSSITFRLSFCFWGFLWLPGVSL